MISCFVIQATPVLLLETEAESGKIRRLSKLTSKCSSMIYNEELEFRMLFISIKIPTSSNISRLVDVSRYNLCDQATGLSTGHWFETRPWNQPQMNFSCVAIINFANAHLGIPSVNTCISDDKSCVGCGDGDELDPGRPLPSLSPGLIKSRRDLFSPILL